MEDARPQAEPVQRNLDGGQRTLAHDLLAAVLIEQSAAAHHTQEGHCGTEGRTDGFRHTDAGETNPQPPQSAWTTSEPLVCHLSSNICTDTKL